MDYKIELTEQPAQPVLSIRTRTSVGNLPKELGRAYQTIAEYLNEIGEQPAGAPFTAYYNMDMENLDVEIGFPVSKVLEGKDEIKASQIPSGKQVSCMHQGSYEASVAAYDVMSKWVMEKGYVPTGVAYEFYFNSPVEVPESELLTKIVFPLK
ncbi:GyrI-like domain-containing protein [Lutispora thermophila]|uniref:Effector-binding domain-containing protein n=1 Tax=Lutispora thermophila DSM 19022 TaxID=1122184 RepID=A0A1M6B758_9FIRM|nr:GyrI-like domain-containing protein [Lutispora thermophila]SHI44584.1 effector-binding domain-containing protein [Lutispora thermophila DSM 19022]